MCNWYGRVEEFHSAVGAIFGRPSLIGAIGPGKFGVEGVHEVEQTVDNDRREVRGVKKGHHDRCVTSPYNCFKAWL